MNQIPDEIRRAFLDPRDVVHTSPMPGGMSGAQVFYCTTSVTPTRDFPVVDLAKDPGPQGSLERSPTSYPNSSGPSYALKRWPARTSIDRVAVVHQVIGGSAASCHLFPRFHRDHQSNETFAVDGKGSVWEMTDWLPGHPLSVDATLDQISIGGQAVGDVHTALASHGTWSKRSPGVQQRWDLIQDSRRWLPNTLNTELSGRVHPAIIEPLSRGVEILRTRWNRNSDQIQLGLSSIRQKPLRTHFVLRDVHREHLLFLTESRAFLAEPPFSKGFTVSGIIDFDAMRVDSPAFDLARWVSSFAIYNQDPTAAVESVLAGYLARAPLSNANEVDQLRKLVQLFAEVSGWLSLINWVKWLVIESRQFQDFQSVAGRLRRLVNLRDVSSL